MELIYFGEHGPPVYAHGGGATTSNVQVYMVLYLDIWNLT